jgi:hypothetical protein
LVLPLKLNEFEHPPSFTFIVKVPMQVGIPVQVKEALREPPPVGMVAEKLPLTCTPRVLVCAQAWLVHRAQSPARMIAATAVEFFFMVFFFPLL